MHFLDPIRKKLIITISCVLLLLWDIIFVITPFANKGSDLKKQIMSIEKNIYELGQEVAAIGTLKEKAGELQSELAAYEKKFPKEEEARRMADDFNGLAQEADINLISAKIIEGSVKNKGEGLLREVPIKITAEGGYHELCKFLNKLENSEKFIELKDMEIAHNPSTPQSHNATFLVSTYVLKKLK